MSVASQNQNPTVGFPFRGSLILRGRLERVVPRFHLAFIPTAWGECGVVWVQHESESCLSMMEHPFAERPGHTLLCRLVTPGLSISGMRRQLLKHYPVCNEVLGVGHGGFHPEVVPEWFGELVRHLQGYYSDSLRGPVAADLDDNWAFWKVRLDWSEVTEFQRKVLEHTASIRRGVKMTYGEVARAIGSARASRAVGAALRVNPWPVLVPCHRVVGAGGAMTGFSAPGGVGAKMRMLEMEREGK